MKKRAQALQHTWLPTLRHRGVSLVPHVEQAFSSPQQARSAAKTEADKVLLVVVVVDEAEAGREGEEATGIPLAWSGRPNGLRSLQMALEERCTLMEPSSATRKGRDLL